MVLAASRQILVHDLSFPKIPFGSPGEVQFRQRRRDCLMVKAKSQAKPDDKKWSKMFIEKAREIGAYEKSSASDQLAKMKPDPTPS